MRKTFVPALAVLALATALAGCAVEISDPDASAAAPNPSIEVESPAAVDEPEETASAPADDAPDDSVLATITRDDMIAAATATIACTPGLVIDQHTAVVRVEGDCDDVTVTADAAVVVLDDVTRVRVTGTGSVVSTLGLRTLEIAGDATTVWWQGSAPQVTDTGVGNVVQREP